MGFGLSDPLFARFGYFCPRMTAVMIQAHRAEQELFKANLPYFMVSGGRMLCVDASDAPLTIVPKGIEHRTVVVSNSGKRFHPERLIRVFEVAIETGEDSVLLTECDSVFVRVPEAVPDGFGCFIAGYCPPEWGCGEWPFLHPPFYMSRDVAKKWVEAAIRIVDADAGNGTPDVFAGMVCVQAGIPIVQLNVYSTNGLDMRAKSKLLEARKAFHNGVWHIHGIKRHDHLEFIFGWTNHFPKDALNQ